MKKYDVLIGGYYGFGNIGDEAILESLCSSLRRVNSEVRICVLSASPEATANRLGVAAVRRDEPSAVIRAMLDAQMYVSGGGSLLQDTTSRRSLLYYTLLMMMGKLICGKLYVFANGFGNLKSSGIAAAALKSADRISVRDRLSARRLAELGIGAERIHITADPALLLEGKKTVFDVRRECGIIGRNYFAVSLRKTKNTEPDISEIKHFACSVDAVPLFVSMEDSYDLELCRSAAQACGGAVFRPRDYTELLSVLRFADFAIGMRLHFLIAAAASGTPFGALSYDCKIDGFMDYIGSGAVISADGFSSEALMHLMGRMTVADSLRLEEMHSLALSDVRMLLKCIAKDSTGIVPRRKIENMR